MNTTIQKTTDIVLALLMIIFGLNKFFGFIPVEPPADPVAQQYMGAMFSSYLFKVVALTEIIGGVLLVIPNTKFIGWMVLLPVIFNIVAFHIAHDFIGNGIWILPTILFVTAGYFNKGNINSLIKQEL